MGLLRSTFDSIRNFQSFAPIAISSFQSGRPTFSDGKYLSFAREGYQANELVYAGIEELASSAAEPRFVIQTPGGLVSEGTRRYLDGRWQDTGGHPMLGLLNMPSPFMDAFSFWANVIMYLYIAGNAYGLIVRSASGKPVELWLMRPDRISIIPSATEYIARYEYDSGSGTPVPLPVADVIHWKKRNPTNDFYGQSPLLAGAGRIDIDNYMKSFVGTFFKRAGVPVGMLNVEGAVDEDTRKEYRDRFSRDYGGPDGWHGLMVISKSKATFTPMTRDLGNSGLVVPELDEISEARILMLLGVPPELIGARVGMQNSSYAQKRAARESFWDETLAPLYKELAGPIVLRLSPNYRDVTGGKFDLADVRALQEDEDKIAARERSDMLAGGMTIEEYRERRGYGGMPAAGMVLVPTTHVPVPVAKVGDYSAVLSAARAPGPEVPA